jgi:hypothetical protein
MTATLNRSCWLCGRKLMAISHAEIETPNGLVWVHKICEYATREHFRKLTAQPPENIDALTRASEIAGRMK